MKKIFLSSLLLLFIILGFGNTVLARDGILGTIQRAENDINDEIDRALWGSPQGGNYADFGVSGGGSFGSGSFDAQWNNVAQGGADLPDGSFVLPDAEDFNEIGANTDLREYVLKVVNYVLTFLGLLCVIMVIYGGFLYVTSAGDDGGAEKGKKIIIYVTIGILIILASFAIVNTVIKAGLGVDPDEIDSYDTGGSGGNGGNNPERVLYRPSYGNDSGNGSVTGNSGLDNLVSTGNFVFDNTSNTGTNSPSGTNNSPSQVQNYGGGILVGDDGSLSFGTKWPNSPALCDMGDGIQKVIDPAQGGTINHTYGKSGQYSIRCLVEIDGQRYPITQNVIVGEATAKITTSKTEAIVGETIEFYGHQSHTPIGQIIKYEWSCMNTEKNSQEGCFKVSDVNANNMENFGTSFTAPGQYSVSLGITSNSDLTDTSEPVIITIGSHQPQNASKIIVTPVDGKPRAFTLKAIDARNLNGGAMGLTYVWNFYNAQNEIMDSKETSSNTITYEFPNQANTDYTVEVKVQETYQGEILPSDETKNTTTAVQVGSLLPVDFNIR